MWIKHCKLRLLIITLSLYRKRAKNIFTDSLEFKCSQKHRHFSDDKNLVIAFIISTESCVIGYNVQCCKNTSVSGSAPASEQFISWWYDALNDLITLVWLYQIWKILFGYFLSFGSCIQNPLGSKWLWFGHVLQISPNRDVDMWGCVWMSCFRGAWSSLNFYKEYLFGFETLVFATSGILSMHEQLVTLQRERKLEIASYDPFKSRILFWR